MLPVGFASRAAVISLVAALFWTGTVIAAPASLGQQPLPTPATDPADRTPSQTNTHQFNQLFGFESTPDICAAGEAYVSGQFNYYSGYPLAGSVNFFGEYGKGQSLRATAQGQYGITDQIAAGAVVPLVYNPDSSDSRFGAGDTLIYGQYKYDRIVDPKLLDMTVQVDVVLPTGNAQKFRDQGKFGVRPLALLYKDFGPVGPGILGAYGLLGVTIKDHVDLREGLAVTYEIQKFAGVVELSDTQFRDPNYGVALLTPGITCRVIPPLEFALGVPIGLGHDSPDWGVTFKVTYGFQN